jgi:hypothetical protein
VGRVPSEHTKRLPELDGLSGRTAHQCHPNTNVKLALRLAAVEPNKIAHITTLFSREIDRTLRAYCAIRIVTEY